MTRGELENEDRAASIVIGNKTNKSHNVRVLRYLREYICLSDEHVLNSHRLVIVKIPTVLRCGSGKLRLTSTSHFKCHALAAMLAPENSTVLSGTQIISKADVPPIKPKSVWHIRVRHTWASDIPCCWDCHLPTKALVASYAGVEERRSGCCAVPRDGRSGVSN